MSCFGGADTYWRASFFSNFLQGEQSSLTTYLAPPLFNEAYGAATDWLKVEDERATRQYKRVVVSGASGVGKSRFGFEIFRRMETEKAQLRLDFVNYVVIDISRLNNDEVVRADLVRNLVRTYARHDDKQCHHLEPAKTLGLEALVPYLARGGQGAGMSDQLQRAALVIHIDEFHLSPRWAMSIMDAVLSYCAYEKFTNVVVVLTGFYTPEEMPSLRNLVSAATAIVPLGYFTREGTTDLVNSWELLRNSINTFYGAHGNLLPLQQSDLSPLLRYLLDDLGGWAYGIVLLGAELASQGRMTSHLWMLAREESPNTESAIAAFLSFNMAELARCETSVYNQLFRLYGNATDVLSTRLTVAGTVKLIALLLCPFEVRVIRVVVGDCIACCSSCFHPQMDR